MHTDAVPAVKHDERDRDDLPREPRRQRRRGRRSVVVAVIKQCSKSSRDCYSEILKFTLLTSHFSLLTSLVSRLSSLSLIMTMNEISTPDPSAGTDLSACEVHPACNMNRGRRHKKASCGCENEQVKNGIPSMMRKGLSLNA